MKALALSLSRSRERSRERRKNEVPIHALLWMIAGVLLTSLGVAGLSNHQAVPALLQLSAPVWVVAWIVFSFGLLRRLSVLSPGRVLVGYFIQCVVSSLFLMCLALPGRFHVVVAATLLGGLAASIGGLVGLRCRPPWWSLLPGTFPGYCTVALLSMLAAATDMLSIKVTLAAVVVIILVTTTAWRVYQLKVLDERIVAVAGPVRLSLVSGVLLFVETAYLATGLLPLLGVFAL